MRPRGIRRLFRFPTRTARDVRTDVRDEIAFHLEMRARDLMAGGMRAEAARAQAEREYGDVPSSVRALVSHDAGLERRRGLGLLAADLGHDASYGLRLVLRHKGFSATAVLTLALAIAGNTTMFSVVNALFFQPLAVRAPQELVRIYTGESTVSWPNVEEIGRRNAVLSGVAAQAGAQMSMSAEPLPVRVSAGLVSPNYFTMLSSPPLAGRVFHAGDRPDVVVLGERFWRLRFNGSPSIVGQALTLDGRRYEVIGIMPRAFRGIAPAGFTRDAWIPLDPNGQHRGLAGDRTAARFEAYGRLGRGVTVAQADAALRVIGAQLAAEYPATSERFGRLEVFGAHGIGLFRGVGKALLPVFVFVGFLTVVAAVVLLASCANLAGLLLGRAAARRQEIAIRLSLGAGRGRLIRQLLTESLMLAALGGSAGLVLAVTLNAVITRAAARLPVLVDLNLGLDVRVIAFTVGISLVSALLFGLAPARRAARANLVGALIGSGDGAAIRQRFRHALIVAQVAFSTLLLFWSGLFGRSLLQAGSVSPGFDPNGVVLAEVQFADEGAGSLERMDAAFVALHDRAARFPGVQHAGWSSIVPLALLGNERFRVARAESAADDPGQWIVASRLGPGWFATVRIPFVAGRDFTWSDRSGAPPVVIVNETLARQFWNGAALGRQIRHGKTTAEVVGIVRDSKYWTLGETIAPAVYLPFRQTPSMLPSTLHIRTTDPRDTAERLRREVHALGPGPAPSLTSMHDAVGAAIVPAQIGALVTAAFGLLGAFLATLGVYGLIAFVVAQRAREIAIRRAIGASAGHVVRVVVGRTARWAAIGVGLGLVAGAVTAPLFGGLLVNVSPRDPLTAVLTAMVVGFSAIAASAPPAVRATRVDPVAALKA